MENKLKLYESLLNDLAALEKECIFLNMEYTREFGEEINNIFSLKIESIALKKKITYCTKKANRGEEIDFDAMEKYVSQLIESYNKELKEMISYKKAVDGEKGKAITFDSKRNIKLMYYKIVHLIHPDLHPELSDNKEVQTLWIKCVDAYKRNDEKILKRVYDHVLLLVNENENLFLDKVEEKISIVEQEINEIKENNPYKFKYVLKDEDEILDLHKKHGEEEKYYLDYIDNLKKELSKFKIIKRKKFDA